MATLTPHEEAMLDWKTAGNATWKPGSSQFIADDRKKQLNQDYNYNNLNKTKAYNYNGAWLFNFINTDVTYAWALKAGMQGSVLFRATEAIGIDEVRRLIDLVASGPEAKRNGAYLNSILKSRLPKVPS